MVRLVTVTVTTETHLGQVDRLRSEGGEPLPPVPVGHTLGEESTVQGGIQRVEKCPAITESILAPCHYLGGRPASARLGSRPVLEIHLWAALGLCKTQLSLYITITE